MKGGWGILKVNYHYLWAQNSSCLEAQETYHQTWFSICALCFYHYQKETYVTRHPFVETKPNRKNWLIWNKLCFPTYVCCTSHLCFSSTMITISSFHLFHDDFCSPVILQLCLWTVKWYYSFYNVHYFSFPSYPLPSFPAMFLKLRIILSFHC